MRNKIYIQHATNWRGIAIKLLALLVLLITTNFGFLDRFELLYASDRWFTLVFYVGIWAVSLGAIVIAALQPSSNVRLAWALLLSVSAAAAYLYTSVSGSNLSVFDALSLWTARHEADRAMAFYQTGLILSGVVFAGSFFIIAAPPVPNHRWVRFGLKWLSWTPAVPVVLIAAIIFIKEGGGSQAMPSQFQPLAVGLVTAVKTASAKQPVRKNVAMLPGNKKPVRNLVLLVDESVRPDYFHWQPLNPYTPQIAANADRIVNFGQAVSGGNCSSYSNAILRLGGTRKNITTSIRTNPEIWRYAKKAGYRTVYIDGQSGLNKDPGLLQNFMTVAETRNIDRVVRFNTVPNPQLDFKLLEVIKQELAGNKPVFIYANKNGAHFPYDEGYPESRSIFVPTVRSEGIDRFATRINSYLNVFRWSVDGFFARLFEDVDLSDTAIVYTSDHGQALYNGKLTHCTVDNPDPREGLVPLFALTGNKALKKRFQHGAKLQMNAASHFSIRPTLLELMGYPRDQIAKLYGSSLFGPPLQNPRFTSGDIFGVFRSTARWTEIDLRKDFRETKILPQPKNRPVAGVVQ